MSVDFLFSESGQRLTGQDVQVRMQLPKAQDQPETVHQPSQALGEEKVRDIPSAEERNRGLHSE